MVAVCGLGLAGCESLSSLQLPSFGFGGAVSTPLNLESDPPGAEAKLSTGATCRTPCSLPAPLAGDLVVSFALPGYQPQSVPIRIVAADGGAAEPEFAAANATARLEPNPVYVELQAVAPPPQKKRPTTRRPRPHATSAARPPRQPAPAAAPAAPAFPEPAPATPAPTAPAAAPTTPSGTTITPATPLPPR